MSIRAMNYVWQTSQTKGADRLMLLAIADSCDDEGCWAPGVATFAEKCNVNERAAQYTLRRLVNQGEVEVLVGQGTRTKTGPTNLYRMTNYRASIGIADTEGVQSTSPLNTEGVQPIAPQAVQPTAPLVLKGVQSTSPLNTEGVQPIAPNPPVLNTSNLFTEQIECVAAAQPAPVVSTVEVCSDSTVTVDAVVVEPAHGKAPRQPDPLWDVLCWIVGWDAKTLDKDSRGQLNQTLGILRVAGYTEVDLRRFWKEVWLKDWRWKNRKSRPTIRQVRQEIGKVRNANDIPSNAKPEVLPVYDPKVWDVSTINF